MHLNINSEHAEETSSCRIGTGEERSLRTHLLNSAKRKRFENDRKGDLRLTVLNGGLLRYLKDFRRHKRLVNMKKAPKSSTGEPFSEDDISACQGVHGRHSISFIPFTSELMIPPPSIPIPRMVCNPNPRPGEFVGVEDEEPISEKINSELEAALETASDVLYELKTGRSFQLEVGLDLIGTPLCEKKNEEKSSKWPSLTGFIQGWLHGFTTEAELPVLIEKEERPLEAESEVLPFKVYYYEDGKLGY